jgi:hypothetical protein
MIRHLKPALLRNFTDRREHHTILFDFTEHTYAILGTNGDLVHPR